MTSHATCSSTNLIYLLTSTQCDASYVGWTKNNFSTKMVTDPPLKLPTTYPFWLLFTPILTHSFLIPIGNYVLQNISLNSNQITHHHLELAYQFISSFRHSFSINLRGILILSSLIQTPLLLFSQDLHPVALTHSVTAAPPPWHVSSTILQLIRTL